MRHAQDHHIIDHAETDLADFAVVRSRIDSSQRKTLKNAARHRKADTMLFDVRLVLSLIPLEHPVLAM
ncbi:hypothetical protein NGM99_15715 [Mesorhizobium sp. RP14(2022)]|uniref:Uncharacterized protein n=1 Tax=Mesorhizobium liriopis TaxID=2953882 RepID=A0ABT1C8X0_9HYPH|nr:hypothetical protein [Mesorhizobium liriopis]MCO6051232.1 hypothetical protein [Mesorhizobium liriopis]